MLTRNESEDRITRLQRLLQASQMDGALIVYPIDIYYYSGTRQNSTLWVPAQGEPMLLVRKSFARASKESLVRDTRPFPSSKEFPTLFGQEIKRIGLTFDVLPVQQYNYYAKLLPGREFLDLSTINRDIRSVKSPWELEKMRKAGAALCSVFEEVPKFLRPGMRELDLAAEFECRLRKAGSEGYVRMRAFNQELFQGLAVSPTAGEPGFFDGAVTGRGLSAASPHGASREPIRADAPVLVDFTGIFDGYIVDMTRMFVVGTLAPELQRAFATSVAIQNSIASGLRPGVVCEDLFVKAASMAEEAGLEKYFMGAPGENARFVGHGVGLELDEVPVLAQGFKAPLAEGQTIAVEPKFVFPGLGVIGIENTFAVGPNGGEKLTTLPDHIVYL
ncbi:MAG TPA: Xaa-Pro peptidase family protein [Geomonas sp.]|nr:Xaa-Pro peptidase family protein [Geomonas sp.]